METAERKVMIAPQEGQDVVFMCFYTITLQPES